MTVSGESGVCKHMCKVCLPYDAGVVQELNVRSFVMRLDDSSKDGHVYCQVVFTCRLWRMSWHKHFFGKRPGRLPVPLQSKSLIERTTYPDSNCVQLRALRDQTPSALSLDSLLRKRSEGWPWCTTYQCPPLPICLEHPSAAQQSSQ